MPNMPQIPPNLSIQYIPNTGGCVIDIAAAINLAQFNIKVQEQYHVEVFPDRICVTLSLPPPGPPPRLRPHTTGPLISPGFPPQIRPYPTAPLPSSPPPPPVSRPTESRPPGGIPQGPIHQPIPPNSNHDDYPIHPWYPGHGRRPPSYPTYPNPVLGSRPPPAKNNQPVPSGSPRLQQPPLPLPPFCNQSAVVIDYTKISTISRHDIKNHLHFLGLIDLNADVDVGIILTSALTDKRRRSGLDGFTGTFSGALGRITGGNRIVNNKGKGNGNAGNGNVHGNGNSTSDGKTPNDQASDPLLPPGIDPEAIRHALIHRYTVQCGFSYRTHRGVRTTTAVSYTECLHTCSMHAFFSTTGAGANECLGGSFDRRAGSGKCWYIVGAAGTTLDSRHKVADENCDSFSLEVVRREMSD